MKIITFLILFFLHLNIFAQEKKYYVPEIFVRVYDLQGTKFAKGKIYSITDSLLYLKRKKEPVKIPVKTIGFIRTKRSRAKNMLVGAAIGIPIMTAVVVANDNPYLPYPVGTFFGATLGTVIGAITIPFKRPKTYVINGNKLKWAEFEKRITGLK